MNATPQSLLAAPVRASACPPGTDYLGI